MTITTDLILAVEPRARILCAAKKFDYIDIVDFSAKQQIQPSPDTLVCTTRSQTEDDLTWYGAQFNRRDRAPALADKGITVLTDEPIHSSPNQIVVPDVYETLEKLHRHVLSVCNPTVIGVTGSVGKTTCVCMMEELFSRHAKTLRLYAKRITPLSMFEMVINRLEPDTRYVVLEYAMYYKHHVAELVRLLPPDLGFLLNVELEHVGIDNLSSLQDIWNAKRALIDSAKFSFVERETKQKLGLNGSGGFDYFAWQDAKSSLNGHEPFIRSELQYMQMAACMTALRVLEGQESEEDLMTLCNSVPKEKRLMRVHVGMLGRVFFDGEVPCAARFSALSKTFYPAKTLVIHQLDPYEDLGSQVEEFAAAFARFDRVYVHEVVYEKLKDILFVPAGSNNVVVYSSAASIQPVGEVFVLWGMYWRQHKTIEAFVSAMT